MCAAFVARLPKGWVAYPETAGWDLLLVRPVDGFQIGLEAKLRLNATVLVQAADHWRRGTLERGPDCRAVLVPRGGLGDLVALARHVGVTVLRMWEPVSDYPQTYPQLPRYGEAWGDGWLEWAPLERLPLPDYVPDVAAGSSAPLKLTRWKIDAMRLVILLERRGFITVQDFKRVKVDPRLWREGGWIQGTPKEGFTKGERCPDFRAMHPRNFAEIEADFDRWAPPEQPRPSAQIPLFADPATPSP